MIKKHKLLKHTILNKKMVKSKRISSPHLYTPRTKLYNCLWVFTIGDPDDNPSVPHAHAQEKGFRLDAWTGNVYPAGNEREKIIGKLSKKELKQLHSDQKFLEFAKKQIEWYRSNFPNISFFVPEWFELKIKQMKLSVKNEVNENKVFAFVGNAVIYYNKSL